jgi:hypothetical protein
MSLQKMERCWRQFLGRFQRDLDVARLTPRNDFSDDYYENKTHYFSKEKRRNLESKKTMIFSENYARLTTQKAPLPFQLFSRNISAETA